MRKLLLGRLGIVSVVDNAIRGISGTFVADGGSNIS